MWLIPGPLAAAGLFADLTLGQRLLGWTVVLALLVAGGAFVILWVRHWRQTLDEEPAEEPSLEDYRKLVEAGLLEPQEYERIRSRLEPPALPPEIQHGIEDPQLRTGIRQPPVPPSTSDPTS